MLPKIKILSCSPRKNGNSDALSELLSQAFLRQKASSQVEIITLRDYHILPCTGCYYCGKQVAKNKVTACFLDHAKTFDPMTGKARHDQAAELFQKISSASLVIMVSSIYFYHLPAQFKAFLDRMQRYWKLMPDEKPGQGNLPLGLALIAARGRGMRLFDGSILSVRYAAECMGMRLAGDLELKGYDQAYELSADPKARISAESFAQEALTWISE